MIYLWAVSTYLKRTATDLKGVVLVHLFLEFGIADIQMNTSINQLLEGHATAHAEFLKRLISVLENMDGREVR